MPEEKVLYFPKFTKGQIVFNRMLNYRGVVFAVDLNFRGSHEWYDVYALNRPPKNRPWYHILIDDHFHTAYVAESNLYKCPLGIPVEHPMLYNYFNHYENGHYSMIRNSGIDGDCLKLGQ